MKKQLTLSIPKPCHEKWSSFSPTPKGGFCSSCQKEVVDFTTWNDDRITRYFRSNRATCGRFTKDQLKTYADTRSRRSRWEVFVSICLLTILSLFWSRPSTAQSREKQRPVVEQRVPAQSLSVVVVSGQVSQADDGTFLPGVNIVRKGTFDGTVTDVNGQFSLKLSNATEDDTLIFSFIGMITQEIPIAEIVAGTANVAMENDVTGVVETLAVRASPIEPTSVLAGLISTVTYVRPSPLSPRRIWYALKEIFTSKSEVLGEPMPSSKSCTTEETVADEVNAIIYSPNPVADRLDVILPDGWHESLISISSINGQLFEERISTKPSEQFDVSALPAGVYILNVTNGERTRSMRIVKM